jgi:cation-transporting ATPase 13A1
MGYVYSGTATACDLTLALFPIWLVWDLQMSKRTKAALVSILSMGCM